MLKLGVLVQQYEPTPWVKFLKMIGYVRKCIPNLSEIAKPLRLLLGKEIARHWSIKCGSIKCIQISEKTANQRSCIKLF